MKNFNITLIILITLLFIHPQTQARKDKNNTNLTNPRVKSLQGEDREMFNALTKKQQKNITQFRVEPGYNAWMVKLAHGTPFYTSENHPIYKDYEEVWLYVRDEIEQTHTENKIIDPVTNWPTVHKVTRTKSCKVGDFFILFDRGVVEKIIKDKSKKRYGSCTINTNEQFIPIVDGKRRKR